MHSATPAREPGALLSPTALAAYLSVPVSTVYGWNSKGDGPPRFRVGRHCRYRVQDVERWLDDQRTGGGARG